MTCLIKSLRILFRHSGQPRRRLGASRNPAKQAKPEDFIDTRFVQQLDESGYIDQLYSRKSAD